MRAILWFWACTTVRSPDPVMSNMLFTQYVVDAVPPNRYKHSLLWNIICMYLRASRCWIYIALNVHLLRIVMMYARVCICIIYMFLLCGLSACGGSQNIILLEYNICYVYICIYLSTYIDINNTILMLQKLCENEWDVFGFDVTSYIYTYTYV